MNKNLKMASIPLLLLSMFSLPALADSEYLEVDNFETIELGVGMIGTISCGSENTVTLKGDKDQLDRIEVTVRSGQLDITRHTSISNILRNIFGDDQKNKSVYVDIVTNGLISTLIASTGSSSKIEACAINDSLLKIDAGTGASVNIQGVTTTLYLDLSTGSMFNQGDTDFTVDIANIDMSTGSTANLCGATTIVGDASTGASIYAAEKAITDEVSLSFGAELIKSNCR